MYSQVPRSRLIGIWPTTITSGSFCCSQRGCTLWLSPSGGNMRIYPFSLAAIFALAFALPSHAAQNPSPAQVAKTKKVWTNEEMDQLRARGLISTFNVAPETTAPAPVAPSEPATFTARTE